MSNERKPKTRPRRRPLKAEPCECERPIMERDLDDVLVCISCGRGVRR